MFLPVASIAATANHAYLASLSYFRLTVSDDNLHSCQRKKQHFQVLYESVPIRVYMYLRLSWNGVVVMLLCITHSVLKSIEYLVHRLFVT